MIIPITSSYYRVVFYIMSAIIGLCVGSFLNVVIYRVPLKMSLAKPPSHCPNCGYKLKFYDNIPILSYIILKGKCRSCKQHIPFRYTAVELSNMLLWLLCSYLFADNFIYGLMAMLCCSVCICIFFIDLEHMIIPDRFQIILLLCGILSIFVDEKYGLWSHLIGFVGAGVSFILISLAVSKASKKEAMGGGDIKLAIVSGLLLGWQKFMFMVLISSISASIIILILNRKSGENIERPFGPYLGIGFLIAMLFGNSIIDLYVSLLMS